MPAHLGDAALPGIHGEQFRYLLTGVLARYNKLMYGLIMLGVVIGLVWCVARGGWLEATR